jgi:hypothetical protein
MYGKRGVQNLAAGAVGPLRLDQYGSLMMAPGSGRLAEAALNGRLFMGANQAAVATSTTLNTTWTGLGLCNPTGSAKLLIVHEFSWALSVVGPAAGLLALAATTDSGLAASITIRSAKWGSATSVAILDDGATVAAPILIKPVSTYGTGAITTWQGATAQVCRIDGGIVIPAGRSLLTDTTTACTAAFLFGFVWEEIDA